MKPVLLDLFCGAGGAAMGYHRAGFEVVGVDIDPQPHYPFEFIQADWQEPLWILPGVWEREGRPYAIHASPPCQAYSGMTKKWGRSADHPDLMEPVREHLAEIGVPFVLENVVGGAAREPDHALRLNGRAAEAGTSPDRRHHGVRSSMVALSAGSLATATGAGAAGLRPRRRQERS